MEQMFENDIAIIGMAGRFPRAKNIAAYWQNLVSGVNCITRATGEELRASTFSEKEVANERFVNASARLEDARYFDAAFFGLSNTEAVHMDPQIRLLLQTSWHAFEDAGYDLQRTSATVGNFCGMSTNSYLLKLLHTNAYGEQIDPLLYRILNDKDFLATWISYKLNLTGPAMTVQTACSTSLLAVHLACQSLLNRECEMALVGGVSFDSNECPGYFYTPESIYSKDGSCRPFDRDASGTVNGDGVGAVILKRATDAIKDNDQVYALIKGTATNNDGANKQGYTTPSVNMQRDVILEAVAVADINPETIGLIEAHGTGTLIGDPIEVTALTEAYREYTGKVQFCALGSVKGNIGHLDAAAGIASLIKAALCVQKGILAPSINYTTPNPALQLDTSPFYVCTNATPWPKHFTTRRAGVTSLGVGGSNVHIILEEPPVMPAKPAGKRPYVVTLSAQHKQNLQQQKNQLARFIGEQPGVSLADIEFTGLYGRKMMPHRFSAVCYSNEELLQQLNGSRNEHCFEASGSIAPCVFMFPGQGSQYAAMAAGLYHENESFRKNMDRCLAYLGTLSDVHFKEILFSPNGDRLNKTANTQVCLFVVEYCLAKELMNAGLQPDALIGHSLGEYVAACLVGCISLEDALLLVYHRGRLMQSVNEGAMLLVKAGETELRSLLRPAVTICAYNAADSLVVGGPVPEVEAQCSIFTSANIEFRKLKVSHAYHTPEMNNMLGEFEQVLSRVQFNDFDGIIFSTYTGNQVSKEQFRSASYWLNQVVHPVKFSQAVETAMAHFSNPVFVEAGPGSGLSSFVQSVSGRKAQTVTVLPRPSGKQNDVHLFYEALAMITVKGVLMQLPVQHEGRRVHLPGYCFSQHWHWKPQLGVRYQQFDAIKDAFHWNNRQYTGNRVRSSVEITLAPEHQWPDEILNQLQQLNNRYINELQQLLASGEKLQNKIEVLYNEMPTGQHHTATAGNELNGKRNVSAVYVAPATDLEKTIAGYWSRALGYHPAGILDNYFEVGGNSLLATKLLTQLSDEFRVALSFRELSEAHTIKELAALVASKQKALELVAEMEIDNNDNCIEL